MSCCVVVDGGDGCRKLIQRGFTRPAWRTALLPYSDELSEELDKMLEHLLLGLNASVLTQDTMPALFSYFDTITEYIKAYGHRFTKETHIKLIHFAIFVMTKEQQFHIIIHSAATLLDHLLSKSPQLKRGDIKVDWRAMFKLYHGATYGKLNLVETSKIVSPISSLRRFYPLEDVPEMWEELQVHISPRYSNKEFCDLCCIFLPVKMTAEEHKKYGTGLWMDIVWELYVVVEMGQKWGANLPGFFSGIPFYAPDAHDFSSKYDDIFIRVLRALNLTLREGKVTVGDGSGQSSLNEYGRWIADMLGGPHSCHSHLGRMMKCVEPFMHPSNDGTHTDLIVQFMQELTDRLLQRVHHERIKKHKRPVNKEYYMTDKDIEGVVDILLQPALFALYNNTSGIDVTRTITNLCSLDPARVIPKFLDYTYPALTSVCEPTRLTQTLDCLLSMIFLLASDKEKSGKRVAMKEEWAKQLEQMNILTEPVYNSRQKSLKENESQDIKKKLITYRHHLIYLMEALIIALDVNDSEKSVIAVHNIILIIYLVPIIDCSACIGLHKDLTEDEKLLCKLSARLPKLAHTILDKILEMIMCMSVCAPKDSSNAIGCLKDETTLNGAEEQVLKKSLDRCICIMLTNASEKVAQELVKKLYIFVTTNQFQSAIAVDMVSSIISQCVYSRPDTWTLFANYIVKNLKEVLTPEVRRLKELDASVMWFVSLSSGLFCTRSEVYRKNKSICFEMIELLLDCDTKVAYESGAQALWYSLFMLSRTYTEQKMTETVNMNRPLNEWVPVREWAITFRLHEVKLRWHVPDDECRVVVEEILNRFMYPVIEQLKDEKISKIKLRKLLFILSLAYCGAAHILKKPESKPIPLIPTSIPWHIINNPEATANIKWNIIHPSGQNVQVLLLNVLKGVTHRLVTEKKEDTQVLATITSILKGMVDPSQIDSGELHSCKQLITEVMKFLANPLNNNKMANIDTIEAVLYNTHLDNMCLPCPLTLTEFDIEIMKFLMQLAMNDYPAVRAAANKDLSGMLMMHTNTRDVLLDDVLAVLNDQNSSKEKLKGALYLILETQWVLSGKPTTRKLLWKALLNMKMIDYADLLSVFNEVKKLIESMKKPKKEKPVECEKLNNFCREWFAELPKKGEWIELASEEGMKAALQKTKDRKEARKRDQEELLNMLYAQLERKDLHHTRIKLARRMLWNCQKDEAKLPTINMVLSTLTDEEHSVRTLSSKQLWYWLQNNKPKTNRQQWKCPVRKQQPPEGVYVQTGLRRDNLCMAYDSENLPRTEEQWNKTVFFSKQYGCFKWPKTIDTIVCARDGELLKRGELSDCEKAIIAAFEDKHKFALYMSQLLTEKQDDMGFNEMTVSIIKYVLRNFPGHPKIFENITEELRKLLGKKQHAEQRLAADLLIGVAKGTKYLPFQQLDAMWKWLAPAVDRLYDRLNTEAEAIWLTSIIEVLAHDDPRRFWWLIEQLIEGMKRPAPSAYHQAVRVDLITAQKWRSTETRKRLCEIAWLQLPKATIETQRIGVSTSLKHICTVFDTNMNNDLSDVPERFQLPGLDHWLRLFEDKIEDMLTGRLKATGEVSEDDNSSMREINGRKSETSASQKYHNKTIVVSDAQVKKSLIYLRTLLELLLQYYEDCMTCLTPGIIRLIPMLLEYANEEESEMPETFKDVDIKQCAALLIHDYMSSLLLTEKFADEYINVYIMTFQQTSKHAWRVRVSVLKHIQVVVFSNIFVCERGKRPERILDVVMKGLADSQIEVRLEAAKSFLTLIHCHYFKVDKMLLSMLSNLSKEGNSGAHGAILGYGAIVMAHPYTTPPEILPALTALCKVNSCNAERHKAATLALREFRRSHRDDWAKTSVSLGPSLLYQIENATAPVYYA